MIQSNPGGQPNLVACDTPNPPWWCEESEPAVDTSYAGLFLFITAILLILYFNFKNEHNTRTRR